MFVLHKKNGFFFLFDHVYKSFLRYTDIALKEMSQQNKDEGVNSLTELPPNSFIRRYSYGEMGGMSKEYHGMEKK